MKSHWIVFAEVMVFFIIYGDAQVTLSRSTTVMIIEDSVSLTCHLDNSLTWNAASLRSFSGPPGFRSLITSGTTVDANKYEETIKASEKTFTMQIKNFSYTDLGDYRCTYLFDTSSTLTLAANEFLEDTPENVKKDENLEADGTTTLKYTLYQVRPQPNITVTVNDNPPPSSDISIKEQMIPNLDNNNYTYDAEFTVEISALKGTDVVKVLIQAGEYTYNRTISIPGTTSTSTSTTHFPSTTSSPSKDCLGSWPLCWWIWLIIVLAVLLLVIICLGCRFGSKNKKFPCFNEKKATPELCHVHDELQDGKGTGKEEYSENSTETFPNNSSLQKSSEYAVNNTEYSSSQM